MKIPKHVLGALANLLDSLRSWTMDALQEQEKEEQAYRQSFEKAPEEHVRPMGPFTRPEKPADPKVVIFRGEEYRPGTCTVLKNRKPDWFCTREAGHDGPCALVPEREEDWPRPLGELLTSDGKEKMTTREDIVGFPTRRKIPGPDIGIQNSEVKYGKLTCQHGTSTRDYCHQCFPITKEVLETSDLALANNLGVRWNPNKIETGVGAGDPAKNLGDDFTDVKPPFVCTTLSHWKNCPHTSEEPCLDCSHPSYRHYDWAEEYQAGCKYCSCVHPRLTSLGGKCPDPAQFLEPQDEDPADCICRAHRRGGLHRYYCPLYGSED